MNDLFSFSLTKTCLHLGGGIGFLLGISISLLLISRSYESWHAVQKKAASVLLGGYIGFLIAITQVLVFPWAWEIDFSNIAFQLRCINLSPFSATETMFHNSVLAGSYTTFIRLIGGNLLLLFPLGILYRILKPNSSCIAAFLLGLSTSMSIELLQLFMNCVGQAGRTPEIDDLIFNTVGCVVGWLITYGGEQLLRRIRIHNTLGSF